MSRHLAEALADCLARIDAGATAREALGHYPELRAELEPLVEAAVAVRALPRRPAGGALRARVGAELARLEREDHQRRRRSWSLPLLLDRPALAARLATVALAAILVLGAAVATAALSRPGRPLAPAREALEDLLARRPEAVPTVTPTIAVDALSSRPATLVPRRPAMARPSPTATPVPPTAIATLAPTGTRAFPPTTPAPATAAPPTPFVPPPEAPETSPPPEPAAATASPTAISMPPITSTATPLPSPSADPADSAELGGGVRQGDDVTSDPLPGVVVEIYVAAAPSACPGGNPLGALAGQAVTDAVGRYALQVPAGTYYVAASGGPSCLPRRWHVGQSDLGAADVCDGQVIDVPAGMAPTSVNVLFERGVGGCATPTP